MPYVNDFSALTIGYNRWNASDRLGTSTVVTYSFLETGELPDGDESPTPFPFDPYRYVSMDSDEREAVRKALALYEAESGLRFVEVDDPADASIRLLGNQSTNLVSWAYFPETEQWGGDTYVGSVYVTITNDPNKAWTTDWSAGSPVYNIIMHEIGHAVGLSHPFEDVVLTPSMDNHDFTIMSYNTSWSGGGTGRSRDTLAPLDIQAIQYLYGPQTDFTASWRSDGQYLLVQGGAGHDAIMTGRVASLMSGGAGNDKLTGVQFNDILQGGEGDDTLRGGAGNDKLTGGVGRDLLIGSNGNDLLAGGDDADRLLGGEGNDRMSGGRGNDHLETTYGRNRLLGEEGNDTLKGGEGADTISGGVGADHLKGGSGTDLMRGDSGADLMYGQEGNDRMFGGTGNDFLDGHFGNDWILGEAGSDTLKGHGQLDTLFGGEGADKLFGGHEDDLLYGDAGADTLLGDEGQDKLNGGLDADRLVGGSGHDLLLGSVGKDTLFGGDGDDTLNGGVDNDLLKGNSGSDTFVFRGPTGTDRILDWQNGWDLIAIERQPGYDSFDDIAEVAKQRGDDVVIVLNARSTIIIEDARLSQLDESDFIL